MFLNNIGNPFAYIHTIYERTSATRQLEASAAMGDADGVDLEALARGWAQPGR